MPALPELVLQLGSQECDGLRSDTMKGREKCEIYALEVIEVPHPHFGQRTDGRHPDGGEGSGNVHDFQSTPPPERPVSRPVPSAGILQ